VFGVGLILASEEPGPFMHAFGVLMVVVGGGFVAACFAHWIVGRVSEKELP
jgi:hypothetical protein